MMPINYALLGMLVSFWGAPSLGFGPQVLLQPPTRSRTTTKASAAAQPGGEAEGSSGGAAPAPSRAFDVQQLGAPGQPSPALSARLLPRDRYLRVWPVALGEFGGAECVVLATVPGVGLVRRFRVCS